MAASCEPTDARGRCRDVQPFMAAEASDFAFHQSNTLRQWVLNCPVLRRKDHKLFSRRAASGEHVSRVLTVRISSIASLFIMS